MIKITKRTRIRLGGKFKDAFNPEDYVDQELYTKQYFWNIASYRHIISRVYDLEYSTRRNGVHYFRPRNEQKLALFLLKYGQYTLNKIPR
jgi:hypothetical protein